MELGIDYLTLVFVAVGLAMDAFSVATVTGFGLPRIDFFQASRLSVAFGFFHFLMPVIGWLAGNTLLELISGFDHWLAFLLLAFVGGRMIYEAVTNGKAIDPAQVLGGMNLLMFSLAVSIDALAVGLSFSLEQVSILIPSLVLGLVTLLFTFAGLLIGNRTGKAFGRNAQIIGGVLLITIGARIVFTHIL